jgi:hypothetical protein
LPLPNVEQVSKSAEESLKRLDERERARMLRVFDELVPRIPLRAAANAYREIAEVRRARRAGGGGIKGSDRVSGKKVSLSPTRERPRKSLTSKGP